MAAMVAAAAVAACSGGGDDGGTGPTPTIEIALSNAALSVVQGASGTVNVTLSRGGGFAGPVDISVTGAPTGVTASAAPATIASGSTSSVITIATTGTVTPATTNLTVRATGTGVTEKTQTLALTVTAAPATSYALAVTPATRSIAQGASGTVDVALTRTNLTGAVALTVEGLPTGVTGTFNPQSVTASSSVLTLNVGATAATGTSTVTVKGTAQGQTDKTATFQLTVTAAVPAGGYTLAVAPAAVTVQQGATGTTAVNITRTGGFAGAVTLAATGLPNGVTAAFNPAAPTTNTSTLTLTASPTAALGQATVTITGTATGLANQTTTLALTVTAATGGTGNTTWEFCSAANTPVWLAVQDGTGAWTRVTPTGTKFQFNIASGRGGVAYVTSTTTPSISAARALSRRMSAALETTLLMRNRALDVRAASRYTARASAFADVVDLTIIYGTQTELNTQGTSQCLAGTGKTVNGSVANVATGQTATVSLGDATASVQGGVATTFQLTDVPDGALDLIASRSTFNQTTFSSVVDKIIIRRGVNAAANSTLPVLDFNAAEAFAPAQATISIGNLGADQVLLTTAYFTSSGTAGAALFSGLQAGVGPFTYYGVPTAKQAAGDLHFAFATAFNATADQGRFQGIYFKDPTDRTLTLGDALPAPTVSSAATTPYLRMRIMGSTTAAYNKYVAATFDQSTAGGTRTVLIGATAGYLNNATTYDLTIPDFSGVAGWNNAWGLQSGVETNWSVSAFGFAGIGIINPNPLEGASFTGAFRAGTF